MPSKKRIQGRPAKACCPAPTSSRVTAARVAGTGLMDSYGGNDGPPPMEKTPQQLREPLRVTASMLVPSMSEIL